MLRTLGFGIGRPDVFGAVEKSERGGEGGREREREKEERERGINIYQWDHSSQFYKKSKNTD